MPILTLLVLFCKSEILELGSIVLHLQMMVDGMLLIANLLFADGTSESYQKHCHLVYLRIRQRKCSTCEFVYLYYINDTVTARNP